jgi:hypothetical protein
VWDTRVATDNFRQFSIVEGCRVTSAALAGSEYLLRKIIGSATCCLQDEGLRPPPTILIPPRHQVYYCMAMARLVEKYGGLNLEETGKLFEWYVMLET